MDIICNKCGMEYSLDDTLIASSGTSVRCMNCNEVFKVYKSSSRGPDQWLLRQAHGPFRTIDNLGLLQQWIQEGKISPEDLISQKNGPWKKVGDIEQLKPFFEMAERNPVPSEGRPKFEKSEHQSTLRRKTRSGKAVDVTERFATLKETPPAERLRAAKAIPVSGPSTIRPAMQKVENEKPTLPPPARPQEPPVGSAAFEEEITHTFNRPEQAAQAAAAAARAKEARAAKAEVPKVGTDAPDFSAIPTANDDVAWGGAGEKHAAAEPAWTEKSVGGLPRYEATVDAMRPPRRSGGKWILIAAALVGVAGAAAFLLWPDQKDELLSTVGDMVTTPEESRFQKFFDRGQESFLLDTDAAFLQADREFQKVLALKEGHPPTLAALARLYAVWAQYIRDAKLDAAADKGGSGGEGKDAALLSREFDEKLQEAVQWSREASAADPHLKAALLAAADTARLRGDLKDASAKVKEAEALGKDAETEYVAAMIDVDSGGAPDAAALRIEKALGSQPMIRALYRIARIQASIGKKDAAEASLKKLFALNSDHPQAKALASRIEEKKKIVLIEPAGSSGRASTGTGVAASEKTTEPAAAVAETRGDEGEEAPQGVSAILKRAEHLQSNGRSSEAKKLYQSVLEREPSNLEALTGIGYSYLDNRETGKALASFRRALAVNSHHGPALIGTAETYKSMGQNEEALKFYRNYLQAAPSGRQAEMARKNIARFEAEMEPSGEPSAKKKAHDDGDEIVIDDSPPSGTPGVAPAAPSEPATKHDEHSPKPEDKPTIIIMKKDESAPSKDESAPSEE